MPGKKTSKIEWNIVEIGITPQTLTLVPFEHYMLADDSPVYPMTFYLRFKLGGTFDRELFGVALQVTLPRHPLLGALINGAVASRTKDLIWKFDTTVSPHVTWLPVGQRVIGVNNPSIDLTRESGARLVIRESAQSTTILLQLHHACCDATGAVDFMRDLLCAYSNAPMVPTSFDSAIAQLGRRLQMPRDKPWRRFWSDYLTILRFYRSIPVGLRSGRINVVQGASVDTPSSCQYVFSPSELTNLRVNAKDVNATINDLLLASLFRTLAKNMDPKIFRNPLRSIRIAMPVNLRHGRQLPATNAVSMSFLSRRPSAILGRTRRALMHSIATETRSIKVKCKAWALLRVVNLARKNSRRHCECYWFQSMF